MDIKLGHEKDMIRFGNLHLIFKVTAVEKLKIHCWGTSIFSENMITSFFNGSYYHHRMICYGHIHCLIGIFTGHILDSQALRKHAYSNI